MKTIVELVKKAGWKNAEHIHPIDIENLERFAALVRADERKRTVEILMEMHRKANGEHNYYHFAANEIQGFNVSAEREWVGLTDDEIEDAVGYSINKAGLSACRRVISAFKAKQGESNV